MDRLPLLKEIFPNKTEAVIVEVINIVEYETPDAPDDEKLETIINLLSETGDSTLENSLSGNEEGDEEEELEGAVGPPRSRKPLLENALLGMFPDIDGNYLRDLINENTDMDFQFFENVLMTNQYPCRKQTSDDIFSDLQDLLPDADPDFLRDKANEYAGNDDLLRQFVENALENNDYPTKDEYLKRQRGRGVFSKYILKFNVEAYLKLVPDPIDKFNKNDRELILTKDNITEDDIKFTKTILYNQYRYLRKKYIDAVFKPRVSLIKMCKKLDKLPKSMRNRRPLENMDVTSSNEELLQLIAFITHKKLIKNTIRNRDKAYKEIKEQAKKCGLLQTCKVCDDDEVIPEECFFCAKGCAYCKDCMKTGIEVAIGDGNLVFPCHYCESEFSIWTLKMVLPAKMFEKLFQRIQQEELKKANLDDLDSCPFCDSVQIFTEGNNIFTCDNPDCLKESCRLCRKESHIPQRCNEIEYDEDVKRRTFIENMMSEALMRTCHSCNKKFIKEHGCNKMTCSCGAKMCYLCGAAIQDYSHFNRGTCQLYTENLTALHLNRVRQGAQQAKQELGNVEIKFDPEANLDQFFN